MVLHEKKTSMINVDNNVYYEVLRIRLGHLTRRMQSTVAGGEVLR